MINLFYWEMYGGESHEKYCQEMYTVLLEAFVHFKIKGTV